MKSRESNGNLSKTVEDYLLSVYTLASEGRTVIAARLAETLEVAPPTVTATLHRMSRDGLIAISPTREIGLTEIGQARAETMVRRHRLAERFMTDILGLDWAECHEEAHRFEHVISPRVEERILAVLGDPTTCPHGSPIPGTGARIAIDAQRLHGVGAGSHIVIERISEEAEDNRELLEYFQRSGLLPGREFDVKEIETYNELILLGQGDQSVPIGMAAAQKIWVRVVDPPAPASVAAQP
ncbi:MAG: metal-dependent transcriptional regulator [Chloroflexi bacterium]|nr:metal-dependent transcriptional regulator [Chloroflexota bacterium]